MWDDLNALKQVTIHDSAKLHRSFSNVKLYKQLKRKDSLYNLVKAKFVKLWATRFGT